jgi:hypothetical protein
VDRPRAAEVNQKWQERLAGRVDCRIVRGLVVSVLLAAGLRVAGLPIGAEAAPSRIAGLAVGLAPTGSSSLPQGRPFALRVTVTNSGGQPSPADVLLKLVDRQTDQVMSFQRWELTVPGGGSVSADFDVTASQWFASLGTFEVAAVLGGVDTGSVLPFTVLPPALAVPLFTDVTGASGLTTATPPSKCGRWTAGAAWQDVDGDEDLDLYVPVHTGPAQLWLNDGLGQFVERGAERGVDNGGANGISAVFADYDNDGDEDLYVVNDGPNRLYRNDGAGWFVDVGVEAGVADAHLGASASWGDYDGDGFLDLYVTNNIECVGGVGSLYQPDVLYHNERTGSFTEQTALLGVDATMGAGFQAAWFDHDHDGDVDLYLANDYYGPDPDANHLWRNDGPGDGGAWRFTDVSSGSGTGYAMHSMGVAVGDYDRDLDLDLAVSDKGGNLLARNEADGTFADVSAASGVERPYQTADLVSVTWGMGFADLNLDGWEDLFVAGGNLGNRLEQSNQLFVNAGDGTFLDLSAPSGTADQFVTRGVAFVDYDRDGRIDLYTINQDGSPVLYRNVTPVDGLHWLEVDTAGGTSNRDGCGARLTLTVAGTKLLRQVLCGSSLGTGSDPTVHFGLGGAKSASKLVIEWPSGKRQVIRNLVVDGLLTVTEP